VQRHIAELFHYPFFTLLAAGEEKKIEEGK
jgi:hypothetical protein